MKNEGKASGLRTPPPLRHFVWSRSLGQHLLTLKEIPEFLPFDSRSNRTALGRQKLNAIPSAVVLEQISVFQGCDLAQGPKIELLPIEPDDLACDLLEAIHAGTLLPKIFGPYDKCPPANAQSTRA